MLSFFPRDVLDEMLNLIESGSGESYLFLDFKGVSDEFLLSTGMLRFVLVPRLNI